MNDGWTLLGVNGSLEFELDPEKVEWENGIDLSLNKTWTMEFKVDHTDPKLFDLLSGRMSPRHAAKSSYYNDTLEAISKVKPSWPRDKGRHIAPGSWLLLVQNWKDKPSEYVWKRHAGTPSIYYIDMDKLNA
jgi:hypothetical protein